MLRERAAALIFAAILLATPAAAPPPRIVAIGDVHGAGDAFVAILQKAGLVDASKRWAGGTTILVQTGDLLDRGPDVRAILDLLITLEAQAATAGGRVQPLLGNHEAMNLLGETRDTSPDVFQKFADEKSETRREEGFEAARKQADTIPLDKTAWLAAHPPGYIEYRQALAPDGSYGKWLRSKPIIAEIAGTVFMHGGINTGFTSESLDNINRRVGRELKEFDEGVRWLQDHQMALPFSTLAEVVQAAQREVLRLQAKTRREELSDDERAEAKAILPLLKLDTSALLNPDGPLWFRGFSSWTDEEGAKRMSALLRKYKVKRFVTGHTPQASGSVTTRFGGTLYLIDTGMLDGKFYPGGRASALDISGDAATPLYASTR